MSYLDKLNDIVMELLNVDYTVKAQLCRLNVEYGVPTHHDDWWGTYYLCGCYFTMEEGDTCVLHALLNMLDMDYEYLSPNEATASHDGHWYKKCQYADCSHCKEDLEEAKRMEERHK